jgi:xanthine/uracil permease
VFSKDAGETITEVFQVISEWEGWNDSQTFLIGVLVAVVLVLVGCLGKPLLSLIGLAIGIIVGLLFGAANS